MSIEFWGGVGMGFTGLVMIWAVVTRGRVWMAKRREWMIDLAASAAHTVRLNQRIDRLSGSMEAELLRIAKDRDQTEEWLRRHDGYIATVQENIQATHEKGHKARLLDRVEALEGQFAESMETVKRVRLRDRVEELEETMEHLVGGRPAAKKRKACSKA